MGARGADYHFDLAIAAEAARRWKERERKRTSNVAAVEKGQFTKAESKDRLAKHVNRLLNAVANVAASAQTGDAARESLVEQIPEVGDLARHGAIVAADINDRF